MSGIGDVFMDLVMTELLVSSINIWDVNVKAMESNTRRSVIKPEEVSCKFNTNINKAKDTLIVTT